MSSQAAGTGGTVPILGAQHKCRLGDAGNLATISFVERSEPSPGGSRGELASSISVADICFRLTPRLKNIHTHPIT